MSCSPIYLHRAQLGEVGCLETRLSKIIGSGGVVSAHTTAFDVDSYCRYVPGLVEEGDMLSSISPRPRPVKTNNCVLPQQRRRTSAGHLKAENGHPGKVVPLIILTREPGFFKNTLPNNADALTMQRPPRFVFLSACGTHAFIMLSVKQNDNNSSSPCSDSKESEFG